MVARATALSTRLAATGLALLSVSACAAPITRTPEVRHQQVAPEGNPQGQAAVHLGYRALDDDAYEFFGLDNAFLFGFDYARRFQPGGVLGWESGLFFAVSGEDDAMGSDMDLLALFWEADLGLRASYDIDRFQVFAGGGAALILADVELLDGSSSVQSENDFAVGPYVHAGAIFYVAPNFFIGVDGRLVTGTDIDFEALDTDADYFQVAFLLG